RHGLAAQSQGLARSLAPRKPIIFGYSTAMKRIAVATTLALVVAPPAIAAPASSANTTHCTFAAGITEVARYADVPAPIREMIGPMAERGGAWQPTDSVTPTAPMLFRRLLRAGHRGDVWFVWYERGGIAYWWQAGVFRMEAGKARTLADVSFPVAWT